MPAKFQGLVLFSLSVEYSKEKKTFAVGAKKKFTFRLRRTVEKRSVPFPLYGQLFRGTLFARSENGQLYTVKVRSRNGNGT